VSGIRICDEIFEMSPEAAARVRRWYRMYRRHYLRNAARWMTRVDAATVAHFAKFPQ